MSLLSQILYRTPVVDRQTLTITRPWAEWLAALVLRAGGAGEVLTISDLLEAGTNDLFSPSLLPAGSAAGLDVVAVPPDRTGALVARLEALEGAAPPAGELARLQALAASFAAAQLDSVVPLPVLLLPDESLTGWSDWRAALGQLAAALADLEQAVLWPAPPGLSSGSRAHLLGGPLAPPTVAITAAGAGANATVTVAGTDTSGTITLVCSVLDTPLGNNDVLTLTFAQAFATAPVVLFMAANDAAWNLAYGVIRCRQADVTTALFKLRSGGVPLPALTAGTYLYNYLVIG